MGDYYLSQGQTCTDLDQGADDDGTSIDHGVMGDSWGNTNQSLVGH